MQLEELAAQINASYAAMIDQRPYRLPVSDIGYECVRRIWMSFRWVSPAKEMSGIARKNVERGNEEEKRIISDLRAAGLNVVDRGGDGKQFPVEACDGHMFGRIDGGANDELGRFMRAGDWVLVEAKSVNSSTFKRLNKLGVAASNPRHHAQIQVYMLRAGFKSALYIARCADTSVDYLEHVQLDESLANRLIAKGERVIYERIAPPPISIDPTYFACQMCPHNSACHGKSYPERNCRTCIRSEARRGGSWWCDKHKMELSAGTQRTGCPDHRYNSHLIKGRAEDVGNGLVRYERHDGSSVIDNGMEMPL